MESVVSIASSVAAGQVRPTAVVAEHIARHAETAGALNALIQPRHVAASAEAEQLEIHLQRGLTAPPLAGVPVSVKECFAVAGQITSLGIPQRRGAIDPVDAAIVTRLRAAGAIIVGKGNVPQAMYLHETDNPVWGRTNHPLHPARGPGGSSGGDAALVAAGVVPLAVGTDLAGSIRQPAHACGVAGFLPRSAVIGEGGAFDTVPHLFVVRPRVGFLAQRVDDLALALEAVVGATTACLSTTGAGDLTGGLRVAWWDDAGPIEPSPAVRRAVHEAVGRLERAGVTTTRLDGGVALEAAWLLLAILSADGGADIRRLFGNTRPIPPVARLLRLAAAPRWQRSLLAAVSQIMGGRIEALALRATGPRAAAAVAQLSEDRTAFAARFAAATAPFDALVCPVSAVPALLHGTAARLLLAAAPCLLANLLDLPAGAVAVTEVWPEEQEKRRRSRDPVMRAAAATDRTSLGLPVGVQVVGVPGGLSATDALRPERVVLDVMRLIERKTFSR